MPSTEAPTQGQIVTCRSRKWVVLDVHKSALPPDVMAGVEASRPQNLVSLSSVEEDGLGEELHVVWEIEAGTAISERSTLPDPKGFDEPRRLDAFLNAVRWGAVSSADVKALHAPFRSGITIEDYQLDPVVRALQMPRVNLLIADDVGLGKSVESGLVIQELMLRHRARTVLVVCPSALQIHWKTILWEKFGLEFRIVDTEAMRRLRRDRGVHVNVWSHFPRLITSIDYIKRDRPLRLFRETLPSKGESAFPRRYDVLIVDEAHNVAPSGIGRYATDSQRTRAIREIVPHFEHRLFLTATPHSGFTEAFTALLELIDDQRFHRGLSFDKEQLAAIMVRRLKSELKNNWDGTPRFPPRVLDHLEVEYTEAERSVHADLAEYTALRQKNATDNAERFASEFVLKMLKKRLLSSPAAFASTLEKHVKSLGSARKAGAKAHRVEVSILRKQEEDLHEEYADDDAYEGATHDLVEVSTRLFRDLDSDEKRLLEALRRYASTEKDRPDAKAQRLITWLNDTLRPKGKWNNERVIIFTEFRSTQKYLMTLFAAEGLSTDERLQTLYGGMDKDDREQIKAAFQASPLESPVRILLATDAASEGIDLQNHCHRLVHFEIPWNPSRMEQRNGRVDRHGQKAKEALIYHFAPKGFDKHAYDQTIPVGKLEGDIEFLTRAAIKVEAIRDDLGTVGPVLNQQVEEAMLGKRQGLDTAAAEQRASEKRREFKVERDLRQQLEKLYNQLQESRKELKLSPENIKAVVDVGLQIADKPPLRPVEVEGLWPDPEGKRKEPCVFAVPPLDGSWAPCAVGLAHPHSGKVRPIVFDHDLAAGRDDIVLAHLNHRLVQMCLRLLRAQVWAPEGQQLISRVSVRMAKKSLVEPVVVAYGRLLVLGSDNARLHEEIITTSRALREGRSAHLNVGETSKAIEAALDIEVPDAFKQRLVKLWPSHRDALMQSLETRKKERTDGLLKFLAERCEKEVKDLTSILTELKRSIEEELKRKPPSQLELFTSIEKEQLERNKDALRARLEAIPAEINRETDALRRRYADPTPRLFPVAVMYLVPEHLARK